MMSYIWAGIAIVSLIFGALNGSIDTVSRAVFEGAQAAVELMLKIGGMIMLWSGVLEVMNRSGMSSALARLLSPVISRLFPSYRNDREIMNSLAENVTANLLGLGNAATPAGLRAVSGMVRLSGDTASEELCRLVVMNTASIQLIPTTVAAVRAAAGAAAPFDILPAVWITSAVSVTVGLVTAKFLEGISKV